MFNECQRFHLFSDCQDCWEARDGFWCGGEGRRRCCCGSHDCQDYQGKTSQVQPPTSQSQDDCQNYQTFNYSGIIRVRFLSIPRLWKGNLDFCWNDQIIKIHLSPPFSSMSLTLIDQLNVSSEPPMKCHSLAFEKQINFRNTINILFSTWLLGRIRIY